MQTIFALPVEIVNATIGIIAPEKNDSRLNILGRSVAGVFDRAAEGISRMILGVSLTVSTLFVPLKLASRGISTSVNYITNGSMVIENNRGMKKLIDIADHITPKAEGNSRLQNETAANLESTDNQIQTQTVEPLSRKTNISDSIHPLGTKEFKTFSTATVEIHRKFVKSLSRGQKTCVDAAEEEKNTKNA